MDPDGDGLTAKQSLTNDPLPEQDQIAGLEDPQGLDRLSEPVRAQKWQVLVGSRIQCSPLEQQARSLPVAARCPQPRAQWRPQERAHHRQMRHKCAFYAFGSHAPMAAAHGSVDRER
jgi:hypothetical protein